MAPKEASVLYDKLNNDYPTLYREHAFSDPKVLAERLSELLQDTALKDVVPKDPASKDAAPEDAAPEDAAQR